MRARLVVLVGMVAAGTVLLAGVHPHGTVSTTEVVHQQFIDPPWRTSGPARASRSADRFAQPAADTTADTSSSSTSSTSPTSSTSVQPTNQPHNERTVRSPQSVGSAGTVPAGRDRIAAAAVASGQWRAFPSTTQADGSRDLGSFWITCYTGGGTTASGHPASDDEVAVDPRVIPLGSRLFIAGFGWRWAYDTGGAVHGNHIDLYRSAGCAGWANPWEDVRE